MPFQPINFMQNQPQGSPFFENLVGNLVNGVKAGYLPSQLSQQRDTQNIANSFSQAQTNKMNAMTPLEVFKQQLANQWAPQLNQSEIDSRRNQGLLQQAQAKNLNATTAGDVLKQQIANQFAPQKNTADIAETNAKAKYYEQGGPGLGVGGKALNTLLNQVSIENPNLTPEQVREAVDVYTNKGGSLKNGTKLNPLSTLTQGALDQFIKYGTTAGILNKRYNTESRSAELPVIEKYISDSIKPYGDTSFGYSSSLEADKLKSDDASQKRVGQFYAGQQLNVERGNISVAIAQGKPGVEIIKDMIDAGKQNIKSSGLKLSEKARQETIRYYSEAVKEAVNAQLKTPGNASDIMSNKGAPTGSTANPESPPLMYDPKTRKFH